MIGEKIGEETSKTMGRRVLSVDGNPVIESSAHGSGTLLGVAYDTDMTYTAKLQPDGSLVGEGIGVLMGKGGETATFTAQGVGKLTASGGVSWRGSLYHRSSHSRWSRLNTIVAMFEYEVDAAGDGKGFVQEWR